MFKVSKDFNISNGTSRVGEIRVRYKDLVLALGEPEESDEFKVSGEWILHDEETGDVFTIYDWKSTDLYDPSLPSVEEFRSNNSPVIFNIGGNNKANVENFKALLLKQIEYAKRGEAHADLELIGVSMPYIKKG